MSAIKNLLIISQKLDIKSIIEKIKVDHNQSEFDLCIFVKLDLDNKELDNVFNKIYDLSNSTDEDIINFYFDKILDLTYKNKNKIEYNNIYYNTLKKCNITTQIQLDKDYFGDNNSYGHYNIIRNYCDFNETSYLEIEHGLHLGGHIIGYERTNFCTGILTFGDYRYKHLRESINKPVIRIGPYIHYASNLYCEDFMNHIKDKLGKTLLIFPVHSLSDVHHKYDQDEFINYIKSFCIKNNFKTVLVCMLFRDIKSDVCENYKKSGFKIVCCGDRNNVDFLNRLKTIINLSDYCMSNSIGTQLGYCIYLNKPYNLFEQDMELYGTEKGIKRELNQAAQCQELYEKEKNIFFKEFESDENIITKKQYDLCNEYWGFHHIKSKEELNFILSFYKNVFIDCKDKILLNKKPSYACQIYNENIQLKLKTLEECYRKLISEGIQ